MTERDLDDLLYDAFVLGVKVMQHVHDIHDDRLPHWQILNQVAEGELTLQRTGNELRHEDPELKSYAETLDNRMGEYAEAERKLARRIVETYKRAFRDDCTFATGSEGGR